MLNKRVKIEKPHQCPLKTPPITLSFLHTATNDQNLHSPSAVQTNKHSLLINFLNDFKELINPLFHLLITTLNKKIIDLAIILKTHFTSNTKFLILGYTTISAKHPDNTAHADATILIRTPIQFTHFPGINEGFLQAVAINSKLNHMPITVIAAYCSPKHKITQTQFENFFNFLGQYFIVGGDLNAKYRLWSCHTTDPKRKSVLKVINK